MFRVTLNGQNYSRVCVTARVSQGSIRGSLFFLIYINDLADNPVYNIRGVATKNGLGRGGEIKIRTFFVSYVLYLRYKKGPDLNLPPK